jgi:hypothetical protein
LFARTYLGKTHHKNWAGRVAQSEGPEFKPHTKKIKTWNELNDTLPRD